MADDIATAIRKMDMWLRTHYHEREANLERNPVVVYTQAMYEPNDVFCYQELNDWVAENSEAGEVFPEYAAIYAELLDVGKTIYQEGIAYQGEEWWELAERLKSAIAKAEAI